MTVRIDATLPDGTIEQLFVDAIVTEGYADKATITDFPREQGPDVSDNIRPEPRRLKLELIVSNTPFEGVSPLAVQGWPQLAENAYIQLNRWKNAGALLSLVTTMGPQVQMAIEDINLTQNAKTGGPVGHLGGARISLSLKQIIIVQNKLVPVLVTRDKRQAPTVKTGVQATEELPESISHAGVDDAKKALSYIRGKF